MVENIGVDIVNKKRIKKSINDDFINMVLTINEKSLYNNLNDNEKTDFLCGIFASKEAIIKAVNKYENPHFLEIEILNLNNEGLSVKFKNYNILLSISHEDNYTVAEAILIF